MGDERLTLEGYREWLTAKKDAGVSQVRVTSALNTLPESAEIAEASLRECAEHDPQDLWTPNGTVPVKGILVGTAEAAALLGVERPRIGRWRAQGDKLPEPVAELAAGPVWLRSDIEALIEATNARRKPRKTVDTEA